MANEPLALAIRPPEAPQEASQEDEYLTLCAALSQSARGRAFLAEHARRSRNADNEALLAAIGRIEARLQADASAVQRLRDDLRMLVTAIRLARPEIDAADPPARAVKLAKLLDLFERRIDAMAEARASELPADAAPRARIALGAESRARARPALRAADAQRARSAAARAGKPLAAAATRRRPARRKPATIAVPEVAVVPETIAAKAAPPPANVEKAAAVPPGRPARRPHGAERRRTLGAVYVIVVPAKAGTHTPCLVERLRNMGPGSR